MREAWATRNGLRRRGSDADNGMNRLGRGRAGERGRDRRGVVLCWPWRSRYPRQHSSHGQRADVWQCREQRVRASYSCRNMTLRMHIHIRPPGCGPRAQGGRRAGRPAVLRRRRRAMAGAAIKPGDPWRPAARQWSWSCARAGGEECSQVGPAETWRDDGPMRLSCFKRNAYEAQGRGPDTGGHGRRNEHGRVGGVVVVSRSSSVVRRLGWLRCSEPAANRLG